MAGPRGRTALVDEDLQEPAAELAAFLIPLEATMHPDEAVLHQLLRPLPLPLTRRKAGQRGRVPGDERGRRPLVSPLPAGHEGPVGAVFACIVRLAHRRLPV